MLSTIVTGLVAAELALAGTHADIDIRARQHVGLWRSLTARDQVVDPPVDALQMTMSAPNKSKAYCFDQKVSHFDDTVTGTFCQQYWIDATYYKPGGPVFVLDGGETAGANRLPFMETGILQILSNATNGLSIILEHRYYGKSVPTPSFSTDDLRFLNNAESLKDSAQFIANFMPPEEVLKLDSPDQLKPSKTPWIYYGGSYAGARAAFMRKEYPDLVWGGIGSSGVTHAQNYFPEYFNPIMKYADQDCIGQVELAIQRIDELLEKPHTTDEIKSRFNLSGLANDDFGQTINIPFGYWQAQNWDPAVGDETFNQFCDAMKGSLGKPDAEIAGEKIAVSAYADFVNEKVVSDCETDVQDCFGTYNESAWLQDDLKQTWRQWQFQVCTQWGYFQVAPPAGEPSIISKFVTLDYAHKICKLAYPPGKYFTVPEWPDVEDVNKRGDFGIEYDRLAFIDGDRDPWREATPGSDRAPKRKSTVNKPIDLIFDAIHHYDENGLEDHSKEPERIRQVHEFMVNFVQEWVAQFKEQHGGGDQGGNGGHGGNGDQGNQDGQGDDNDQGGKDHGHGHGHDKGHKGDKGDDNEQ